MTHGGHLVQGRRPHEPEELRLLVTRTPSGGLVLRTPFTPGWAFPARCPADLARGIEAAYAEVACAMYARWRGVLYDLAETEDCIPPEAFAATRPAPAETPDEVEQQRAKRRKKHPATYDPEQWVELESGHLLSPGGKRYRPDSLVAARVRAARGHP